MRDQWKGGKKRNGKGVDIVSRKREGEWFRMTESFEERKKESLKEGRKKQNNS